ncbi:MAG: adenylate/guanylate cyclase domain-containing protein [Hyphomicrobiales bacterium]|nr:adenylate/guanylate cyclase domain-containing protein [Hyphomicrobiales bacterium]
MMSIAQLPEKLRIVLGATVISAVIGAVYAEFGVVTHGLAAFAWYRLPRGALTGAMIASLLTSLEVYVLWTPLGSSLRRAPFPVHVAVKTLIYLIVIVSALSLSAWVFPAPGEGGIEGGDVLFSLAASFVFVFVMAVNKLLGQNVLLSFVTGRYHRPRVEERVLLFIDMEGSTGLAERLGPLSFHRLLNRFVTDLTDPIVAARGEIYSYVGDELIATWKLEEGIRHARCVTACFDAFDALARKAHAYRREFGAAVNFRAGLHCGPLVTGEMGSVKTEIVFLGDSVNTAARIQDVCRQTGDRILASADLIDRLQLPPGIVKRSLGDFRLRGKGVDLALYALSSAAGERSDRPELEGVCGEIEAP